MELVNQFIYGDLPEEMRHDPLLRNLKVSGPFGPSHDRLRTLYYNLRDGKSTRYIDKEAVKVDFDYICNSQGLINRQDDYRKEFSVVCGRIGEFLKAAEK